MVTKSGFLEVALCKLPSNHADNRFEVISSKQHISERPKFSRFDSESAQAENFQLLFTHYLSWIHVNKQMKMRGAIFGKWSCCFKLKPDPRYRSGEVLW